MGTKKEGRQSPMRHCRLYLIQYDICLGLTRFIVKLHRKESNICLFDLQRQ